MSLVVVQRYEKNIVAAADFDAIHAETNHLQKMSLSDLQEQNKERNLVGDGSNQSQTRSPGAHSSVDNHFESLISAEKIRESIKQEREWHASHSCTRCGVCNHRCPCKRRAPRRTPWDGSSEFKKKILLGKNGIRKDDNTLPPWLAKRRQEVLEQGKDLDLSFF